MSQFPKKKGRVSL